MPEDRSIINTGLRGVIVASTKISDVDGATGKLIYRGYLAKELAGRVSFEEVAHLLLFEKLPGAEALEAFSLNHHGVLLMDLHMPVMDGQSAFMTLEKRCREQDWEMPRVVFCSGFAPPTELRERVARDSAHCMLSKPVANEVLVDAIRPGLNFSA